MDDRLRTTAGQRNLPRWFETVFALAARIRRGGIDFALPDGRVFRAEGPDAGPIGVITVRDTRLFARMVREGEMGFCEAYMDGWFDTPDLQALFDVILDNNEEVARSFTGGVLGRLVDGLRHWLNRNTRGQARRNIEAHYDLGNGFYSKWLDPSMTYSSALFQGSQESLEAAQRNKYAALCDSLNVAPGDHVLEVGCGWGGFAEFAAKERGLKVTGLTISPAQHEFASRRMFEAGLSDQVDIVIRDYRDETGCYDGLASIEMFEAVGEKFWPVYFDTVRERLNPDRLATLQIITIADRLFQSYRKSVDFVQKHIFPGGMLPSQDALKTQTGLAGLDIVGSIEFGESYSETLRRWRSTFNDGWQDIARLGFDDRFWRMWNLYLASCAACFLTKTTDVTQLTLRRPA